MKKQFYRLGRKSIIDVIAIVLLLVFLASTFLLGPAGAADRLSTLELRLLGQKFSQRSTESRIQHLEKVFHLKPPANASLQYRLSRLYEFADLQASGQVQKLAVQAYNKGVDETQQGNLEAAIQAYQESLKLNPKFIPAYNNLGNLLEQVHQYEEAIQIYQKALRHAPQDPILHRNLGILYEKVGKTAEAFSEFQEYLKFTPEPDQTIAMAVKNYEEQISSQENTPDYVAIASQGSQGQRLIWPKHLIPIPVLIELDPDQAPFLPAIQESLKQWEEASQGRVQFHEIGNPHQARIKIRLQEGPLSHPFLEVGHASYNVENGADAEGGDMQVSIRVNTGERELPISLETRLTHVKRLVLHELGHAIGIWGHSTNPEDIMFARPLAFALSQRDRRTLQRLYED